MQSVMRSAALDVAMVLLAVGPAFAQDVSGTWQFTVELDVGAGMPTIVFRHDEGEGTLSGTYQGTFGQAEVSGTIDGTRIEFWFETQGIKATYTGTVDGDTMSGTCDYGDIGSGVWEGVRSPEEIGARPLPAPWRGATRRSAPNDPSRARSS